MCTSVIALRVIVKFCFALVVSATLSTARAGTPLPLPEDGLLVLCYHDVVESVHGLHDADAIETSAMVAHFAWLRESGYHPVSLEQVIRAREGRGTLPSRPVLLTFDDGYKSFYTRAFPLLRLYHFPAVLAIVGSWLEAPRGSMVAYGDQRVPREKFLDWDEVRALAKSGLVEIASHSYDLHKGILANHEGTRQPAAVTRSFDPQTGRYESDAMYATRIKADLARNSSLIEHETGARPRSVVWPFGRYNQSTLAIARSLGMPISFTLEDGFLKSADSLAEIPRNLIEKNPGLQDFLWSLRATTQVDAERVVLAALDDLHAEDGAERERRLSRFLDRIADLKPSAVVLRAWHGAAADGEPDSVYFPNRQLPVRSDLLNRVAWQLFTRGGVTVYASLPFASRRLDPAALTSLYEDMARAAPIQGLFFEGVEPAAAQNYPDTARSLVQAALAYRAPLQTIASVDGERMLVDVQADQKLLDLLDHYDRVALAVRPDVDVEAVARMIAAARARPSGAKRVVFQLQVNRAATDPVAASERAGKRLREILRAGGVSLGYGLDDPAADFPTLKDVRPGVSRRAYPD